MDADIANLRPDLLPTSDEAKFLNRSYEERLESLRHIIIPLYLTKKDSDGQSKFIPITQVCAFMKTNYNFYASESQYRNWFKKWGVRRRILTSEKKDIVSTLGRRTHPGTSTSNVTLGESKEVDKKQMKRFLSDQVRQARRAPERAPGVLLSWNLPYAAYAKAWGADRSNYSSPFATSGATPSYLTAHSPDATTPGREPTTVGPSPTMQLVRKKVAYDRAALFLQGRTQQLLESCGREDRITMVKYLHDLYLFSFVKAKYWGKGPRDWTAGMVAAFISGSFEIASPLSLTSAPSPATNQGSNNAFEPPTQLCCWSIHVADDQTYDDEIDEIPAQAVAQANEAEGFDMKDPSSWKEWPKTPTVNLADSFSRSLSTSISEERFSLAPPAELPLSTKSITQSIQQDSEGLVVDACKAAIMAGNYELVASLAGQAERGVGFHHHAPWKRIYEIHPFHLAATYLDGGHTCCGVLSNLLGSLGWGSLFYHNLDDLGHTVLDCLMVNVLRSHTKISPELVSRNFDPPNRFPGEEKSMCGRWDADAPAIHQLFSHGYARIPSSWKHAFCHTSVQSICHSAIAIFGSPVSPPVNHDSGLFVRRCTDCGLELRLGPLHTLVVVAFNLAHRGMAGETLFGALALLVCLLSLGADPCLTKQISVADILGPTESGTCHHRPMDPLALMQGVPETLVAGWTTECQTGWRCMLEVFVLAKAEQEDLSGGPDTSDSASESDDSEFRRPGGFDCDLAGAHSDWLMLPCMGPKMGTIWATIQTELLTYRRIETSAPWISENFSMRALERWLTGEDEDFDTPLLHGIMSSEHSRCGWFYNAEDFMCPNAENVSEEWFMNMDGRYDRATFLGPTLFTDWWENVYPIE